MRLIGNDLPRPTADGLETHGPEQAQGEEALRDIRKGCSVTAATHLILRTREVRQAVDFPDGHPDARRQPVPRFDEVIRVGFRHGALDGIDFFRQPLSDSQ